MRRPVVLSRWIAAGLFCGLAVTFALADPPRRVEEEEEGGGMPKKVIRVDDPVKTPGKVPAALDIDLVAATQQARHPGIRDLFASLAIPHDVVQINNPIVKNRANENVKPLPDYIGQKTGSLKGIIKFHPYDKDWKEKPELPLGATAVREVIHYEELAEKEVDKFLNEPFEKLPANHEKHLSAVDKYVAAEQALYAVARFHEAARESQVRKGEAWNAVRDALRAKLLGLTVKRLELLGEAGDWDGALALAADTGRRFPGASEQQSLSGPLVKIVQQSLDVSVDADKYGKALARIQQLERSLPSAATADLRKRLSNEAAILLTRAKSLKEAGKLKEAQETLRQAEATYPYLPGLRELRAEVADGDPTLKVGVRELPHLMSPATAFTDAEKQAVELIFEGLYELGPEPDGGRFRPALARGRPGLVPLGREVSLPRDALWSDGKPITSTDVVSTLRLLRSDWPGRIPAWADDLLDDSVVTDPLQVRLTLKQGCLDPLSLMTFKVLPSSAGLRRPDDAEFARNPIGSGPYMLDPSHRSEAGRPSTRFVANPYYRNRPGRLGLPRIGEVQFFTLPVGSKDPVGDIARDFADERLNFIPDVPLDLVSGLKKKGINVSGPIPSRRIWMLAINNRRVDNAALRRAIALAVPREKIIKECFRGDLGDKVHQPLTGPFPTGSWACPPPKEDERTDPLSNPAAARAALAAAKKGKVELELKFPMGDDGIEKAMRTLAETVSKELGITINLKPVTMQGLHDDVVKDREYDLAYFWYDYPDTKFWLWPLLDSRAARINGSNFLNYPSGGRLETPCREALNHRNFDRVQSITHTIHQAFIQEMPFVPLWQLDRFIAHAGNVHLLDGNRPINLAGPEAPEIDPLRIFGTAETWRVGGK